VKLDPQLGSRQDLISTASASNLPQLPRVQPSPGGASNLQRFQNAPPVLPISLAGPQGGGQLNQAILKDID